MSALEREKQNIQSNKAAQKKINILYLTVLV